MSKQTFDLGWKMGREELVEKILNLFKKDSIYTGEVIEFEINQLMQKQSEVKQ